VIDGQPPATQHERDALRASSAKTLRLAAEKRRKSRARHIRWPKVPSVEAVPRAGADERLDIVGTVFKWMVIKAARYHHLHPATVFLAMEWGPFGVRSDAIHPGYIRTPIAKAACPIY
jgi:NAD(P)-dependent dehydrogenase (short-subunit alcohol dehydrogenase family)